MIVSVISWTKVPTANGFELCTMESSVEVPREFWRYFFAGQAFDEKDPHRALAVRVAVADADALLAELEKGGGA